MTYKKIFYTIIPCWLMMGLQSLDAQVSPDAPKTTTTVAADSLKDVQILHAVKLQFKRPNDTTDLQILSGDVRLKQGNTLFLCDSCVINNNKHLFEAFGHVHINDSDTTNIYSDYLKYLTDKKIAYFNGNVKLTDGHGELTTPDMDYDMNTKIGTYVHGGRVVNKKSVLTSDEGYYYADLKDVYFKKHVLLKDPAYDLKADSLLYSTAFETVRFITKTTIVDSSKRTIITSEGFYDLKRGKAEFGKRPTVQDGKTTIIADHIAFDDSTGISQAKGNAIIRDTAQGTIIIADEIFRNRKTEAILATKKPLMIIKQDNDSIYVSADTLFSARLTDLYSRPSSFQKDSMHFADSLQHPGQLLNPDSVVKRAPVSPVSAAPQASGLLRDNTVPVTDSVWHRISLAKQASAILPDSQKFVQSLINRDSVSKTQVLPQKKTMVKIAAQARDSLPASDSSKGGQIRLVVKGPKDSVSSATTASLNEKDSTNRYFEAYRHVRIFSDSMQAISDSMFYSFHDSTFRLYYDPILWSKGNQVTGDTIYLMTKNKKADRMQVINNSMLINKLENEAYNQVKSTRMDAWFLNGDIDSVRAKGSAECIYYLQDKDSAYTGINQSSSDLMDLYFRNKEMHRVVFRSQVRGTIWPIRQKSPAEMKLQNFRWLENRRPKTKYELLE